MPQEYEQASDEFVKWILNKIEKSSALSSSSISNALDYLYAHYKTPLDVLGSIVEIREIDEAVNSRL